MASSQPAPPPATETTTTTSQSQSALYARFHTYPFATDDEYQAGLSSILGHPGTPTTAAEVDANPGLVLNAKLFYFAQTHNLAATALDARGYVDWLRTQTGSGTQPQETEVAQQQPQLSQQPQQQQQDKQEDEDNNKVKENEKGQEQPPYPSSFQAIIDLITSNKPVPGIEQIPDTVLEHGSSKVDHTPRRRKPWEKEEEQEAGDSGDAEPQQQQQQQQQQQTSIVPGETDEDNADKPVQTGDGLLRILQPNAIPPSGLLANND